VRGREATEGERIRYSPSILPRYAAVETRVDPVLYLKGISTGDFEEALAALVGKDAPVYGVDHRPPRRRTSWRWQSAICQQSYVMGRRHHLEAQSGTGTVHLVIIGATPEGKRTGPVTDGLRESAESWRELLLDLRRRGLAAAPQLAVADGALGFWKALGEVWPTTREQRCWVHKTANVLNKLPKSLHAKAKRALHQVWMAETKKDALVAFDVFVDAYGVKYEKAAECLTKDRDVLLAFYDFPAEHWKHLRTTNPIESTFATVRHRTIRSKNCLSNKTALAMVFKLVEAAQKSWRRLRGYNQLPKVVQGVKFSDGIEVVRPQAQAAA
jgi:transposase-like protein